MNTAFKEEIIKQFGQVDCVEGKNKELYVPIPEAELQKTIAVLQGSSFELVSLFCAQNFNAEGFTLFYVFEKLGFEEILVLQCHLNGNEAPSIAKTYPSACWYEREVTDGFGVQFQGAFDTRRLFLHETYSADFHPLLKSFKNSKITTVPSNEANAYQFKQVTGEGVYQIPVGPVHAGIIEPGHFRFSVIGETIFNLEVRLFYKHRGLEKLAEGKSVQDCVKIAEAISGDETVANAVAYCTAVEKICDAEVPKRALQFRTVMLELERVYSHLGDLAGMCVDVAYPVGASPFFILREEIFRQNEALTGSRFLKGVVAVGGLAKDISAESLQALSKYLEAFKGRFEEATHVNTSFFSVADRFETTGKVKPEIIEPLHLTGPVARAAGKTVDTRLDHPYGLYRELKVKAKTDQNGDVQARFNVKVKEVQCAVKMIKTILNQLEAGEVQAPIQVKDGYALSMTEAPRGQNVHWLRIRGGVVDRYKVRTASFCNWQAMEHAVPGNIVPDFPLINKSMNLSYAGTDM
ncbi:MAG: NADH-quinone oxidoreductase subunit C [Candidatus Bathyarchaeia archaeon]|jgi:Ni,Fe-hydrogenase III large subunit/Ni,Fe-hydrogenase III component G